MFFEEDLEQLRRERFRPAAVIGYVRGAGVRVRRQLEANPGAVRSVWIAALGFFAGAFLIATVLAIAYDRALAYDFFLQTSLWILAAANEEYDVLICGTFQMSEYLQAIAPKYPDKKFIIYDVSVDYQACGEGCKNVYSITYKQNEGSYLAGLYAGLMSPGVNGWHERRKDHRHSRRTGHPRDQ